MNEQERIKELEKALEEAKKDQACWFDQYNKVKSKYENFRDLVKSVVILIEE